MTDRGVECDERLEPPRRDAVDPQATGITFGSPKKPPWTVSADDAGLRPVGGAGRPGVQAELPVHGQLLDRRGRS